MTSRISLRFLAYRLALAVVATLIVSSIVFIGVHQLPGTAFLGDRKLDESAIAALMHRYGLDEPLLTQYQQFLVGLAHGDLGESLVNQGVQITPLLLREALVSAEVGIFALLITVGLGIPLGALAASRKDSRLDTTVTAGASIAYAIPNFVIASVLVLVFAVWLFSFTGGRFYYELGWNGLFGTPLQVPIPAIAVGLPYAGLMCRLTRASMLETIRDDYVRTARAKGLSGRVVARRHVFRNALIPIVTALGPISLGILTGSIVVENVFGIPGLGKEFVTSILNRDYNIVIGLFTVYALLIALMNVAVDITYVAIDPRVRY
jgi:oligopeptide transport system permease protein